MTDDLLNAHGCRCDWCTGKTALREPQKMPGTGRPSEASRAADRNLVAPEHAPRLPARVIGAMWDGQRARKDAERGRG